MPMGYLLATRQVHDFGFSEKMRLPLTIVIPTKNEERNLLGCLECLGDSFDKILVVDSGSTDTTKDIAAKANVEILDFQWNGKFPKKRNWTLSHYRFETEWVLFLDADERVTPEFIHSLQATLGQTPHVGFWLNFENWFMGSQLRYGDRFKKLALFRVGAGEYEKFPEDSWSKLDMEIHEHPVLQGALGEITTPLGHHDYRGLHHYISKHNEYSTWEANRFRWLENADDDQWILLTQRQKFKYKHLDKWWLAFLYFTVSYFLKLGFLDGRTGWVFNRMKMRYFGDIRLKILEDRYAKASRS